MNPAHLKPAVLFTLLALSLPAVAAEPFAFKGIALGSEIALIAKDPRFDCRNVTTPTADRVCMLRVQEEETIAGVPVTTLYYYYDRAHLTGIVMGADAENFNKIATALQGKYGAPKADVVTVKNYAGASFQNRMLTWQQAGGRLAVEQYAGRLDRTMIRFTDEAAAERIRQRKSLAPGKDL